MNLTRTWHSNKALRTVVYAILSLVTVAAIGLGIFILTPAGKESYTPVAIPELSSELTYVPEPPEGEPDAPDAPHIQVDMLGQQVQSPGGTNTTNGEPGYTGDPEQRTRDMNQVSNIGTRFTIPSVGLDVPLGELTMVDDVIEPTNFTSVFAIRNMGVPYTETANGTTYLATHALDVRPEGNVFSYTPGGLAPGNFFFNVENGDLAVSEGAEINVGDRKFAVTGSERIGKGVISQDSDLWNAGIPNRLVILLCQPDSNDNHVVYATPIS